MIVELWSGGLHYSVNETQWKRKRKNNMYVCLSVCLSFRWSVCLSVCALVCLPVCPLVSILS
jgi:hypothetical protein